MLRYFVRDMYGAMRFLPIGLFAGVLAAATVRMVNIRRSRRGGHPIRIVPATCFCVCLIVMIG